MQASMCIPCAADFSGGQWGVVFRVIMLRRSCATEKHLIQNQLIIVRKEENSQTKVKPHSNNICFCLPPKKKENSSNLDSLAHLVLYCVPVCVQASLGKEAE